MEPPMEAIPVALARLARTGTNGCDSRGNDQRRAGAAEDAEDDEELPVS